MELKSSKYLRMFSCKILKLNLKVITHLNENPPIFFLICFLFHSLVLVTLLL